MKRALIAVLFAGPALAESHSDMAVLDACIGRLSAPQDHAQWCKGVVAEPCLRQEETRSSAVMARCIDAETAAWDAIRAREYEALTKGLDDEQRAALWRSQAAWQEFRDASCALPTLIERTDLGPPWAADCRLDHTANRALELRGYRDYRGY